jgi:endonuclease YncB( thermonuclease family)
MRPLIVALCLLVPQLAAAETVVGRVVGIADGDTLTILDGWNRQHKIRLYGIDAPEKAQPFGSVSKQNLSRLTFGRDVAVDCTRVDRYGRQVCVVRVDGIDVGLAQIAAGLAWWYRQYAREQSAQDRSTYDQAEEVARSAGVGLWSERQIVPPWDYRHRGLTSARY